MKITIGHLYPDLLNLYGDRGNIACLMKRCQWRGIEAETIEFESDDVIDFSKLVRLNDTSAYLWEALEGKDFDAEMLCGLLCDRYEVDPERALEDSRKLIQQFVDLHLVEQQ